ncbi:chitinase protein PB1E7.04c, partial [Biomphalaria glabrata]
LIARSSDEISLYLHRDLGDSMIVFPIDALGREYELSRMAGGDDYGNTAALLLFTPFNNTSISVTPMKESNSDAPSGPATTASSIPSSSPAYATPLKPENIFLDAFEIRHYYVDRSKRYRLHSNDVFGVVLLQSVDALVPNETLCKDVNLSLFDFVPPYSVRGRHFYIAFPNTTDISIYIHGLPNTTVDITSDWSSSEVHLDHLGTNLSHIRKTASAWLSASQAVSVYLRVPMCNGSSPCHDSGFFLTSVEHYFTCEGNRTHDGCLCTCPSFFERSMDPASFHFLHNSSDSLPTSVYPLMVGALFDITTTIQSAFEDADYVTVTTNNSFLVFRYDLTNLNFLPSGGMLPHSKCSQAHSRALFVTCDEAAEVPDTTHSSHYSVPNQCSCEFLEKPTDPILGDRVGEVVVAPPSSGKKSGPSDYWETGDEDTARPLIAVIVSLCVAIFAVIALISGYMLVELTSRRKHVRNPKIRPFVS